VLATRAIRSTARTLPGKAHCAAKKFIAKVQVLGFYGIVQRL
jgi:hypothetical protein